MPKFITDNGGAFVILAFAGVAVLLNVAPLPDNIANLLANLMLAALFVVVFSVFAWILLALLVLPNLRQNPKKPIDE
jgi:hypothetical protein